MHPVWTRILALSLIVFLQIHCGGAAAGSSSASGSAGTPNTLSADNILQLSETSDGLEAELSDLSDEETVTVVLFSYSESSTSNGFELGDEVSDGFLGLETDSNDSDLDASESEDSEDLTEEFHNHLRELEGDIDADAAMASPPEQSPWMQFSTLGDQRTFKVLNSFSSSSSYDTVTATLRYQTDDFEFYVDDRDESSLTDDDLEALAEDFEAVIPDERNLFGTESDVNSDGKFTVLFTQVVNGLGGSSGGIVTGFFYGVDLLDSDDYPVSNEMEVFYTFVPDPTGEYGATISKSFALSNILPGVLPHEYQHMISFNQHYFINSGSAEVGWLNEGLSHLAEDIYSMDSSGYMVSTGLENPARVSSYLNNVENVCFTCGTSLNQRGGSYLFARYLYEQAEKGNLTGASSGLEFLNQLLDTNLRSFDNIINAAFGSSGTESDFQTVLGQFALTLYLSNTGATADNTYNYDGIDLRATQDDNRGTTLNGPNIQTVSSLPFSDTLTGVSTTYLEVSGATLNANGGRLELSVGTGADFGGFVIRE